MINNKKNMFLSRQKNGVGLVRRSVLHLRIIFFWHYLYLGLFVSVSLSFCLRLFLESRHHYSKTNHTSCQHYNTWLLPNLFNEAGRSWNPHEESHSRRIHLPFRLWSHYNHICCTQFSTFCSIFDGNYTLSSTRKRTALCTYGKCKHKISF